MGLANSPLKICAIAVNPPNSAKFEDQQTEKLNQTEYPFQISIDLQ